jgi:hypothetical protein
MSQTVEKKVTTFTELQRVVNLNRRSMVNLSGFYTNKPKSFLDGTTVDTFKALSVINKLEYHHIFPKAFLKELRYSKSEINSHSNICMQNLSNNREISDNKPSIYFVVMERRLGDKLLPVLESNFVTLEGFNAGKGDNYGLFAQERYHALETKLISLVDEEVL